jgi:hypothetical protein
MKNLKLTQKEVQLIEYALECQIADNKESVKNRIFRIQDKIEELNK